MDFIGEKQEIDPGMFLVTWYLKFRWKMIELLKNYFENSPAKDKSSSFKKNEKADTAAHSDKSAKSPVNAKA